MGKIVTIYLSDDEAMDLKNFCDENQCTQYSALKTAVKQLLSRPVQRDIEVPQEIIEEPQENVISDVEPKEVVDQSEDTPVSKEERLVKLLKKLSQKRQ